MRTARDFWRDYFNYENELDKKKMLLTLTGINKSNVTIFKSYIDDVSDFINEEL